MKTRYQLIAIFLLMFSLSSCDLGTFNADGSEGSDFSFNTPLDWEVLYDSKSTWVLQEIGTISVDENDDLTGFGPSTIGIGFQIYDQEEFVGETPLEILNNREALVKESLAAFEEGDLDRGIKFGVDNSPPSADFFTKMIQSPSIVQYCDKEIAIMEFEFLISDDPPVPFLNKYEGFVVIDDQLVVIDAIISYSDKESFDRVLEQLVCSLEVHEQE